MGLHIIVLQAVEMNVSFLEVVERVRLILSNLIDQK